MRSKEKNMDLTSTENEAAKKVKKADKWADKPAMEVRDLHFSYGKNKVLKGVSLKIEEGKITTIMGANGCGKSTLFSLMTKNLYPRKGNIFLKGKNIQNLNLKEFARKVAIVQQYNSASDDITVENLVAFGRTPHKKMMQGDSAEDERMIQWALEVTNLTEYRDREVSRLSGGQRQRVWITMALCQGTKTLFLDETTTYLDIRYQIEILQLVKKLNQEFEITIIMVLHDINQAIAYSDNVIGMKDGKVLVEGDPEEVITEESIRELYGIELGVTRVCWRCKKEIVAERQEIKGRKTPTGEQKEDEKSFKSSMDRAWISLPGTWYDRNCTSYPANRSVLYGNTVLLCKEF